MNKIKIYNENVIEEIKNILETVEKNAPDEVNEVYNILNTKQERVYKLLSAKLHDNSAVVCLVDEDDIRDILERDEIEEPSEIDVVRIANIMSKNLSDTDSYNYALYESVRKVYGK